MNSIPYVLRFAILDATKTSLLDLVHTFPLRDREAVTTVELHTQKFEVLNDFHNREELEAYARKSFNAGVFPLSIYTLSNCRANNISYTTEESVSGEFALGANRISLGNAKNAWQDLKRFNFEKVRVECEGSTAHPRILDMVGDVVSLGYTPVSVSIEGENALKFDYMVELIRGSHIGTENGRIYVDNRDCILAGFKSATLSDEEIRQIQQWLEKARSKA